MFEVDCQNCICGTDGKPTKCVDTTPCGAIFSEVGDTLIKKMTSHFKISQFVVFVICQNPAFSGQCKKCLTKLRFRYQIIPCVVILNGKVFLFMIIFYSLMYCYCSVILIILTMLKFLFATCINSKQNLTLLTSD